MNVYAHSTSNDYALNTIEYMVKKKTDSAIRLKRFLIVFLAIVIAIGACFFVSKVPAHRIRVPHYSGRNDYGRYNRR